MACQKCASNKSTSCSCHSTSYTIPANAVYGDSTCYHPTETCESVTCTECVRHCHGEDKWCTDLFLFDYGAPISPIQLSLAASQAQLHMNWCIDFRCNKLDPDDYSVALPTYLLSSLQLEITYAAPSATNYGSNPPTSFNTNVTTRITCVEGIPEAGEDFSSNPLLTVLTKTLTADTSTGTLEPFDTYFQV